MKEFINVPDLGHGAVDHKGLPRGLKFQLTFEILEVISFVSRTGKS